MIKSAVPAARLEGLHDIYEEEDKENEKSYTSRSGTKSKLLTDRSGKSRSRFLLDDSDSETDPYAHSQIMDMEKIAKLKMVKGLDKKRQYKLLDDGQTNIEAESRRNPSGKVLPVRVVDPVVMNAIIDE